MPVHIYTKKKTVPFLVWRCALIVCSIGGPHYDKAPGGKVSSVPIIIIVLLLPYMAPVWKLARAKARRRMVRGRRETKQKVWPKKIISVWRSCTRCYPGEA